MKTKTDEEQQIDELKEIIQEAKKMLGEASVQSRVFAVIASYFSIEDPDERIHERFVDWLTDSENEPEKEAALAYIFDNEFAPGKTRIKRKLNLSALLEEGARIPPITDQDGAERSIEMFRFVLKEPSLVDVN